MDVIRTPLTPEQAREIADDENFIEGVVSVDLSDIIENNHEGFLDIISEKLIGNDLLMNTEYEVAGAEPTGAVLIKVSGDASYILDKII